jgi:hypothetical protein
MAVHAFFSALQKNLCSFAVSPPVRKEKEGNEGHKSVLTPMRNEKVCLTQKNRLGLPFIWPFCHKSILCRVRTHVIRPMTDSIYAFPLEVGFLEFLSCLSDLIGVRTKIETLSPLYAMRGSNRMAIHIYAELVTCRRTFNLLSPSGVKQKVYV